MYACSQGLTGCVFVLVVESMYRYKVKEKSFSRGQPKPKHECTGAGLSASKRAALGFRTLVSNLRSRRISLCKEFHFLSLAESLSHGGQTRSQVVLVHDRAEGHQNRARRSAVLKGQLHVVHCVSSTRWSCTTHWWFDFASLGLEAVSCCAFHSGSIWRSISPCECDPYDPT